MTFAFASTTPSGNLCDLWIVLPYGWVILYKRSKRIVLAYTRVFLPYYVPSYILRHNIMYFCILNFHEQMIRLCIPPVRMLASRKDVHKTSFPWWCPITVKGPLFKMLGCHVVTFFPDDGAENFVSCDRVGNAYMY